MRLFVLVCVFFGGLGQGIVNPKLPEILLDHSQLAVDSGISASLMYLGIFLASFVYGRYCDRGYVFRLLAGGLLAYSLVLICFALSKSRESIFILRFLEGLSLSAIFVAADFVLCRASSAKERGQWLSYYGVALSIGLLFGPAIILLLDFCTIPHSLFLSLIGVAAVSASLSLISFLFHLPSTEAPSNLPLPAAQAGLAAVLYGFFEAGLVATLAATVLRSSNMRVEYIFILIIFFAAISSIYWGYAIDRLGGRKTLQRVFLILFLGLLALSLAPTLHPVENRILVASVFFGIAAGGIYPAGFAWLIEGSDPSQYGYASGFFTRAYGLGSLFGPLCFGLIIERTGQSGLYSIAAILGFMGILVTRYGNTAAKK